MQGILDFIFNHHMTTFAMIIISVTSTPTSSTASSRQIVSKVYSNSAKQPIPSPEEVNISW